MELTAIGTMGRDFPNIYQKLLQHPVGISHIETKKTIPHPEEEDLIGHPMTGSLIDHPMKAHPCLEVE